MKIADHQCTNTSGWQCDGQSALLNSSRILLEADPNISSYMARQIDERASLSNRSTGAPDASISMKTTFMIRENKEVHRRMKGSSK